MVQSAFIVEVPEAEPYVAQLRERFDPSARLGVPAHVTVLYPFMPPEHVDESVLQQVQSLLSAFDGFGFVLDRVGRFPGTAYLAPEAADRFVSLTLGLVRLFPEYRPYGGRHESIVPHLTVAQAAEAELDAVESQLRAALPAAGIAASCNELVLIENSSGRWRPLYSFRLGYTEPDFALRQEG